MKITDDSPPVLTALDRPNSYIGRSVPRPNLQRLTQGRGQYVSDVTLPRMAHVAFVRSPHAHARIKSIGAEAAKKSPGVIAVVTGAELAKVMTPWVGVLTHLKGLKSAPQYPDRGRARLLAGRSRVRCGGAHARASGGCLRTGRGEIRAPARRHRSGNRARQEHAGDPLLARRQSLLRTQAGSRHARQGLRRIRRGGGDHLHVRPPHRRHHRAARRGRRLERRRRAHDRLSRHASAAHDAEPVRQAPRLGGTPSARVDERCRRLVRHQGAHICRRDGDRRAVQAAQAAGEIRRRPHREFRHRHPRARPPHQGQDRRQERRHHYRLRDRRPHRHRPLFGLSAHQRHRGQPDRQPGRRPLHLRQLPGAGARGVPEQERHVPVPRGRPPDRGGGDGRACRTGRGANRHGPAGNPPAQPDRRRRLSVHVRCWAQVRETLPPRVARPSRLDDELRRLARRAEKAARARHLSRHRLCLVHRGDQSLRRLLRRRRRPHHLAGRRHREARRARQYQRRDRRHRAGPGRRGRGGAMRRHFVRRFDRQSARDHRRHRQHALWRRHLGLARGRHRRRSGLAGRQVFYYIYTPTICTFKHLYTSAVYNMSAARSASRCTPMPTKWRRWRCPSCSSGR